MKKWFPKYLFYLISVLAFALSSYKAINSTIFSFHATQPDKTYFKEIVSDGFNYNAIEEDEDYEKPVVAYYFSSTIQILIYKEPAFKHFYIKFKKNKFQTVLDLLIQNRVLRL